MSLDPHLQRIVVEVEYLAYLDRYTIVCDAPMYAVLQEAITVGLQVAIGPHVVVTFHEQRYPQAPQPRALEDP